ncbi:hypothetical protein I3843_03G014000 [Carya illinoinensis]|nr:hypothetical protein I3843_03G014000 [Carya illinoinensis]
MDFFNTILNWVVPSASLVILAFAWPTPQIAYEYAKRRTNLVLVARREQRLRVVSENARLMGAKHVTFIAANVVEEDDCRRFVNETINSYGRLDHLVNTASMEHAFYFEEVIDTSCILFSDLGPFFLPDINFWGNVYPTYASLPYLHLSNGRIVVNAAVETWLTLPRMSLYAATKAALVNFYDTLRFEVKDDVGITIATHGRIGSEMTGGKFMLEDVQICNGRKKEKEYMEEYARLIVSGACRGDAYVKCPSWYDICLLFRFFAPNVLNWTLRLLLETHGARTTLVPLLDQNGKN